MTTRRWYIGLSSGSSLNGVDAALVRIDGCGADLRLHLDAFTHLPFGRDLRQLLQRVHGGEPALRSIGVLHRVLGEAFASAARQLIEQGKLGVNQVLAVGCPGHVLWHEAEGRYPSSLALGMMEAIAERTGLTVVSGFRGRDIVVGGQGCPMTPLVDYRLFHDPDEDRVLVHLGGMATVVSLPADAGPSLRHIVGFHAAPCTQLLDGLMHLMTSGREPFDPGGKYAVQGCCIDALLERWLQHPILQRRPPKGIPRDEFSADFLQQAVQLARERQANLHDLLCTATHFVARAIVQAVRDFVPDSPRRVILSGGGVRNGLLWRLLEQHLAPLPIEKTDVHGIPAEARKAVAFAGLAAFTMDGIPANLPAATGAVGPRLLGNLTPGSSANWARCLSWMARQSAPLQAAA